MLAASQNNGALKIFQLNRKVNNIKLLPDDESAVVIYKDGTKQKQEFYYGASFLSQSGRFITVNSNVKGIMITNSKGQTREVLTN